MLEELMEYNKKFVENKEYTHLISDKYPRKKLAILTCMDTRLTELLPAALNLKNGDVKLIKNAGALISSPFGSVMRSLVVAIYELEVEEILVIGHYDCGIQSLDACKLIEKMKKRNISKETIRIIKNSGIDLDRWLEGFGNVTSSVKSTVDIIKNHPLIPNDIEIHGLIIDPATGKLDLIK